MRPTLIARAVGLAVAERLRQAKVKGYTPEHDDQHACEELAVASAICMLPASLNPDVAYALDNSLICESLASMLETQSFEVRRGDGPLFDDPTDEQLDARIEVLTTGVALGLAELERILWLRGNPRDITGDRDVDFCGNVAAEILFALDDQAER